MPRYRITNQVTKEAFEVEAPFAQVACERSGWMMGNCYIQCIREGPFTDISEEGENKVIEALENIVNRVKEYQQEAKFATENRSLLEDPHYESELKAKLVDPLLDDLSKMEEMLREFWEKFDKRFPAV